ncbi:MAG TPA: hypothetical protein VFU01_10110 [Gemmatimonadaceae bacterium]|nr:hypothetical protein [Gemmatimonadaceae bacterium]
MADAQPPGLAPRRACAGAQGLSDELLGLKPLTAKTSLKTARLLKCLRRIEELPPADLKLIDAMLETRRRTRKAS